MRKLLHLFAFNKNYDSLIAAVAGFLLIYIYTRHSGIGISPDSVVYISTAKNLYEQGLPLDYSHRYLVIFPLFYPILLSGLMFVLRTDIVSFAPLLNASLFAFVIYTAGWMIDRFNLRFKWYKEILLSCLVVSPCLLEIYSMVWSETLFLVLLLFFIILLSRYLDQPSLKKLLGISILAGIACVTRYIGISMIVCGCIIILFSYHVAGLKKWIHLFLFSILSSSFLIMNLVHNYVYSSTLTGMRLKGSTPIFRNIGYFGNVLCSWLPLPENNHALSILVTLLLLGLFSLVILIRFIRREHFSAYENISMVFFVIYTCFMLITATLSSYEVFTSRLISAAFIPMFFGGGSLIMHSIRKTSSQKIRIWATVITLMLFAAFQIKQIKTDFENYDGIKDAGIPGYTEDSWTKDSEIDHFLMKNPPFFKKDYTIYSNLDDAAYYFSGLTCTNLPHHLLDLEKEKFRRDKKAYLIWFEDDSNANLLNLQESLQLNPMKLLKQFNNGAIYVTE